MDIKISSFFDENGNIDVKLINPEAGKGYLTELIRWINEDIKDKYQANKPLAINQLRKFYDNFLRIFNNKSEEKEKKIQLIMLKANAEYSAKRLKTNRFSEMFKERVNLVVSKSGEEFIKNIKALKLHLEALVAYYPKGNKGE